MDYVYLGSIAFGEPRSTRERLGTGHPFGPSGSPRQPAAEEAAGDSPSHLSGEPPSLSSRPLRSLPRGCCRSSLKMAVDLAAHERQRGDQENCDQRDDQGVLHERLTFLTRPAAPVESRRAPACQPEPCDVRLLRVRPPAAGGRRWIQPTDKIRPKMVPLDPRKAWVEPSLRSRAASVGRGPARYG